MGCWGSSTKERFGVPFVKFIGKLNIKINKFEKILQVFETIA